MSFKTFVFPEDVEGVQLDLECKTRTYKTGVQKSKEDLAQSLGNGCHYAEEFRSTAFIQIADAVRDGDLTWLERLHKIMAIVDVTQAAVNKADERQAHFEEVLHAITNGAVSIRKESDYE